MAIQTTPPSPAVPVESNSQDGLMFSLRIVNLEYYLSPPQPGIDVCYSKFQGRTVMEVPVVRIYGATPAGQKACLHLHQVFPYFYVPYGDDLPQETSEALAYVRCLASAIEKAMKLASSSAAKKQHVHSCSLVRARRYYGYYPSEELFIKIVLYHPQEVARISTLLLGGGIMNRKFLPHESHIPYLLQFLIDQNLAGMSYIHLSSVKFRRPIPERPSDTMHVIQQLKAEFMQRSLNIDVTVTEADDDVKIRTAQSMEATPSSTNEWLGSGPGGKSHTRSWVESTIPAHWVWSSHYSTGGPFGRHSTCELEVDASVEDILNQKELVFIPLHEAGRAIKLVQSLTPMWEEERLRTGEDGPAGAAYALRPSLDRFLPSPSALEQALRDSLYQIVQDEERVHHLEHRSGQFLKSTQEVLLGCSQAANTVRPEVAPQDLEPRLDTNSIGAEGWLADDERGPSREHSASDQGGQDELINENVIRSQLNLQSRASQEVEEEVAELLEWMGAFHQDIMGESGSEDDEKEQEIRRVLSQPWDSPTMEAAMLQALSNFEHASQKECQEILECANYDDCVEDEGEEDLETSLLEMNLEGLATVQRNGAGSERFSSGIPQVNGSSDEYEKTSGVVFDRYTEHIDTLHTEGETKIPRVIFGVDDPLKFVQKDLEHHQQYLPKIPQNDGAGDTDAETERDFLPEPKRMRLCLRQSSAGCRKDSHDRKEKDTSKRSVWGSLPLVGGTSDSKTVKKEKKEQRPYKQALPVVSNQRNEDHLRPRKEVTRVVEVAARDQRPGISVDSKTKVAEVKSKDAEVSLRALMRRKRERRLRSKDPSLSGGSSIVGSQSEGEQSFGGVGIVKSESSLPGDSESQEQDVIKQNTAASSPPLAKEKDEEKMEELVISNQGTTLPRVVGQTTKFQVLTLGSNGAEQITRGSQGMEIDSGRGSTIRLSNADSIYPVDDALGKSESRSMHQDSETNKLPPKFEDLSVKWNHHLHEIGDHRDCGGGRVLNAETSALNVQNSAGIQVYSQVPEAVLFEKVERSSESEESEHLFPASTSGPAVQKEAFLQCKDLHAARGADALKSTSFAKGTRLFWAEVVKDIVENTSDKVTLRKTQLSNYDVNDLQDIDNVTPQRKIRLVSEDVGYLTASLLSESFRPQRPDVVSDEILVDNAELIETQLVEHEIIRRLKEQEMTCTADMESDMTQSIIQREAAFEEEVDRDEVFGAILIGDREGSIGNLSQADISVNINIVSVPDETETVFNKLDREIKESPPMIPVNVNHDAVPRIEGHEVPGIVFTDMSDESEDSLDWGDDSGNFHRLNDSDEGADVPEEEELRTRLPNSPTYVNPGSPMHANGVDPVVKGEDLVHVEALQVPSARDVRCKNAESTLNSTPKAFFTETHTNSNFLMEIPEAQLFPATRENMNTVGLSKGSSGSCGTSTVFGAVLGEAQASGGFSKEVGDMVKEISSPKSSSLVKIGMGICKLKSEPGQDNHYLSIPTEGQSESSDKNNNTVFLHEAKGFAYSEDNKGRESEMIVEVSASEKAKGKDSAPQTREYNMQEAKDDTLLPVKFYQKPPSRDALMGTLCQYKLRNVDYGGVFYGNSKDVPARATVSAGLIFDVKTKEAFDLPPFLFGAENKKSRFSSTRAEQRTSPTPLSPGMGVPCYYENDGSVSYLLTPAKPPPSRFAVQQWLSENNVTDAQSHLSTRGERLFTMDANTGKLVPIDEAGSNRSTQESFPLQHSDEDYFRPASPKYDEHHVLATPMVSHFSVSPACAPSVKRSSKKSNANGEVASGSNSLHSNPELNEKKVTAQASPSLHNNSPSSQTLECVAPPLAKDKLKNELLRGRNTEGGTSKGISKATAIFRDVSQITAPSPLKGHSTPLSQSGFRDPASVGAGQQLTLMSIEVHSETRGNLRPDPRYDAIGMVVVDIQYDDETRGHINNQTLVLLVDGKAASSSKNVDGVTGCSIIYLADELLLLKCFVRLVRSCDPDMLVGWEIQGYSLGLLAERAANLGFGLLKELSRIPPKAQPHSSNGVKEGDSNTHSNSADGQPKFQELKNSVFGDMIPLETGAADSVITDEWGRTNGSGLFVGGRIILNLWRIMRGEVKLGVYTLEAVAEAVLRRRVPRIPWRILTRWFARGPARGRCRCIKYFIDRAKLNFEIIDQLDLLNRTSELARVFGIDFYSVFSRGSQFRVESMMLRLAHTQNFLLLSPSRQQVAAQPAMECLPLVMEPESRFYTSPVVVLDFQSLYPSMIIAYNLCFSTCLGKIVSQNPKVLGVTNLAIPPGLLQELKDLLTITPNGVMYTPPEVRHGVVPRLLSEILSTRIMVKQAMKNLAVDQKVLKRVLNARQFALKLIANVTYGYTAAGFSGRMPCAELADSIVQCGRLTLERAIHLVNTTKRWDARVVYGDTDSMFVHLEGRTREEAFQIGQDIAASVTAMNPSPVTLKMEKVYHPCVLLTKKRYVGFSYESPNQRNPTFDAKGIETIRRDSCAAVSKTLERSLRTLFETQDLSQVKAYLQRQWGKIISGRVSLRDFVFAKEVRLGTYSARASVLPAAAIVASKAMALDPRAEPRYAERVPYVVVHGEPGARLSDVVVDPHTMLANGLRLHDTYYITKQIIPALQRVFGLVGADLKQWYAELPRIYRPPTSKRPGIVTSNGPSKAPAEVERSNKGYLSKGTIDDYYLSQHCAVCGELMRGSQFICSSCSANPQAAVAVLTTQTAQLEKEFKHLEAICRHCDGGDGGPEGHIACVSLDCPIFFERIKVQKELQALSTISANCGYYPTCFVDFGSELF
uniref:DNA polymerase zeta catalytic subunit n=1 Tax=Physcomitrium patens TaxID=3218 RepID=A0A7I4D3U3_PHYPA